MHLAILLDPIDTVILGRDLGLGPDVTSARHLPHFFHVKRVANHEVRSSSAKDHWLGWAATESHACIWSEPCRISTRELNGRSRKAVKLIQIVAGGTNPRTKLAS